MGWRAGDHLNRVAICSNRSGRYGRRARVSSNRSGRYGRRALQVRAWRRHAGGADAHRPPPPLRAFAPPPAKVGGTDRR
eukprot:1881003-Prymnesium_polylepis.1